MLINTCKPISSHVQSFVMSAEELMVRVEGADDGAIDCQDQDGADDGADKAGAFARFIPADMLPEPSREDRSDDTLYLMLQNRIYRGEIVHNEQSYLGEHEPITDQTLWDAVQVQLAGNAAERNDGGKTRQPSLLAGMLFDGDRNRMTPSHAVKKGTRYRYYVSGSLITKDRTEGSSGLRIPASSPIPRAVLPASEINNTGLIKRRRSEPQESGGGSR
jgi:hypothetical protein